MKLDHPFLQLPLSFDANVLAREIEALGEAAWRPHPQGLPGNSALPLVSVGGDPDSDAMRGHMRPTPQLQACPYLMQAMHSIGAVWGRSRLMRLSGQAEVTPHVDINYYWREHMRVHVPIVTQPTVRFHCGDATVNMAAGECWIFDTWRLHRVHNDDHRPRIHLVADTVGGRGFWQLMRRCRPHDRQIPGWQPHNVQPGEGGALDYESFNFPLVMSPWEVREHLGFLMGETHPDESLRAFAQGVVGPFVRDWHALWAKYGDSGEGLAEYRELRDLMREQMTRFEGLRMANGVALVKAVGAIVTNNLVQAESVVDAEPRKQPEAIPLSSTTNAPRTQSAMTDGNVPLVHERPTPKFDRPVIILSAPRSGSTLLFETLAKAPGLFTIGGESHRVIEKLPGLHPSARGYESNRLGAADASPTVIASVQSNFAQSLRNRDGGMPVPGVPVRLLEKTPKNTLRLPFLRQIFPDARFVYLYREPRQVLASMIEAWQSGSFYTYPNLPGWTGLTWSLLLVPGWRELIGRPLEEVVARQWAATTDVLLDDLQSVPPSQVVGIRYDRFIAQPQVEIKRVCERIDVEWDVDLTDLALSRHTVTPPDPEKWRKHEEALARVLPSIEATRQRAERFFAV